MAAFDSRVQPVGGHNDYLVRYYEARYQKYIKRMGAWLSKDLERKTARWGLKTKDFEISADIRITIRHK
jgi:hypothetical protein